MPVSTTRCQHEFPDMIPQLLFNKKSQNCSKLNNCWSQKSKPTFGIIIISCVSDYLKKINKILLNDISHRFLMKSTNYLMARTHWRSLYVKYQRYHHPCLPWPSDTNGKNPIIMCFALPWVAKASKAGDFAPWKCRWFRKQTLPMYMSL